LLRASNRSFSESKIDISPKCVATPEEEENGQDHQRALAVQRLLSKPIAPTRQ